MNLPKLRFKEFGGEWEERTIEEITKSLKSGLSRKLSHQDIGLPVIRANNIEDGKLTYNDLKYWYVDDPQGANTKNYLIAKNDLLINFINSEAKMGTTTIVLDTPSRDMIYTTNILKMQTNNLANNYFFYCYTQTKKYKDYIKVITKPAVNQASFTTIDFKKHSLNIPRVEEQEKIASFFSKLDKKIQFQKEKINLLKEQKKGYMQKIFKQEIRFKDENGREYVEWEEKPLKSCVTALKGNSFDNEIDSSIPVLTISAKKGFVNQKERFSEVIAGNSLNKYTELQKNDLSYNKGNSKTAKYGCVYMQKDFDTALVPNVYKSFRAREHINPLFLQYLFASKLIDRQLRKIITSTARMDGLLNVSDDDFYEMNILLPSTGEQGTIANFLSKLDEKIQIEEQKLDSLQEQKKGFIQQMFV
ncbi:restriction endonuclease subunit S [Bacillus pseudomycoides]|uniref:Restriction endonuclease subunit S n=1 Tax=Bacillus bingmayongensis TaxID=1150157 RepID=A0ABU5JY51_9BACI|nr:restriction endonuclease subunit S [Bacillus pseudomycoides]